MGFLSSVGNAISGAASSVGNLIKPFSGLIAGGLSAYGGYLGNEASAKEAQKNRDWQERMSNTAHQRQVKDLAAAGLNPILSARYGGASTPSGGVALQKDIITPGVQAYLNSAQTQSNVQLQSAQAGLAGSQSSLASANVGKVEEEIKNLSVSRKYTEEQISRAAMEIQKMMSEIDRNYAESYGKELSNIQEAIATDFIENHPLIKEAGTIARELGIGARDFLDMFNFSIGRWIGSFKRLQ